MDIAEAFTQHSTQIYKYVFVRVGNNKELAEDITQDVFLKAWHSRDTFDPSKSSAKTWLFVIARNKIVDHYRQNNPNTETEVDSAPVLGSHEDQAMDMNVSLQQCIKKLSTAEQELINLKYITGLSIQEVSQIINKEESATKVACFRALKKLTQLANE